MKDLWNDQLQAHEQLQPIYTQSQDPNPCHGISTSRNNPKRGKDPGVEQKNKPKQKKEKEKKKDIESHPDDHNPHLRYKKRISHGPTEVSKSDPKHNTEQAKPHTVPPSLYILSSGSIPVMHRLPAVLFVGADAPFLPRMFYLWKTWKLTRSREGSLPFFLSPFGVAGYSGSLVC